MNLQRLSDQLRIMRYRAGLEQSELAARSGVGAKSISSFETGQRVGSLKVQQLDQLAAAVGLRAEQVFMIEPTADERIILRLGGQAVVRRVQRAAPVPFKRQREPHDPLRSFSRRDS